MFFRKPNLISTLSQIWTFSCYYKCIKGSEYLGVVTWRIILIQRSSFTSNFKIFLQQKNVIKTNKKLIYEKKCLNQDQKELQGGQGLQSCPCHWTTKCFWDLDHLLPPLWRLAMETSSRTCKILISRGWSPTLCHLLSFVHTILVDPLHHAH